MTIRIFFNIIILGFAAYGSYRVLENALTFYTDQHWQYYFYWIAPWALLYGSVKAWHQSFVWRRMLGARQNPPILSRGGYQQQRTKRHPSILEHICAALFILALAAILKIFSIHSIAWWIGSLIFSWACLRIVLIRIRRP
ncbi:hypothetical protein [Candidatus Vondammii sp. HM_W22]|uniref:hypothetical protein n=1 Tax=Candidatus Vondammii sp. HM_W22 TaxID=2687299 RepID=UPI001F131B8B|nr:hypothetical protein [Candidatus Vondammii sp. HM_W22]